MREKRDTSLGGDIVRLTVSKVVTLCISTVTSMLLARFRTLEEYGTYSQMLLVINLFSTIFMLGLPNSINYFLSRAETREERQQFLSVYYTLSTILSLVMGGALVCAVPLIAAYFHNPAIRGFLYFLALYPWACVISSSIENILVVYKKTQFLMAYRLISSVLILGCVLLVQALGRGFREYMVAYMGIECILAISVYGIAYHLSGKIAFRVSLPFIKRIFAFSIPLGLASIVGTLNIEIDKLLIGKLMSTEEMAIYSVASKELPLTIVASSITAILLPKFAGMIKENRTKDAVALWGTATELSLIFMGVLVAGIVTYADEVMEIMYSSKYLPGVSVFRIYTLVLLLRVTYFGIILNSQGKTKQIMYCSILALVLNMILNPLLYLLLGIIGPAIATFLAILTISMLQLVMTSKCTGLPFRSVFPWKQCGGILLLNGLLAFAFCGVKEIFPLEAWIGNIAESVVLGILWTAIYVLTEKRKIVKLWSQLNEG